MPSNNHSRPASPSSSRPKTDLPRRPKRQRTPKPPAFASARRSAPARLPPQVGCPVAPLSLFLHLVPELSFGGLIAGDDNTAQASLPPTPSPSPEHDAAIARLNVLVADSTLTLNEQILLQAAMITAQSFVSPGETHTLLHTIASPLTPTTEIIGLGAIIIAGMRAFIAQSGPSATGSSTSGSSGSAPARSEHVKNACAARDDSTCVVTGRRVGGSCHIIPFSVKRDKADHFWAFVAMFKGRAETEQLKRMSLGPAPSSTDNIRNVVWLSQDTHSCFDKGQLVIVPVITQASYDPATATEYTARIELPYGADTVELNVWSTTTDGRRQSDVLVSGHTITLRTSDPASLPLPHPILFQLHTAFTRLRKMCAAAGVALLPDTTPDSDDGEDMEISEYSECDYQALLQDDEAGPPQFAENDQWLVSSGGLPLKKHLLQLVCGSDDSEPEQYYNVMKHWGYDRGGSEGMDAQFVRKQQQVLREKKRLFELINRDGSGSDRSRPATEELWSKRRRETPWEGFRLAEG